MTSAAGGSLTGARVLVTGASGFIGSHLCAALALAGSVGEIHGLTRRKAPRAGSMTWWEGDLSDAERAREVVEKCKPDVVFHLASEVVGGRDLDLVLPTFSSNLAATVNLLRATAEVGCKRFVLTGSMEEPGPGDTGEVPGSPYAVAKWAGSTYARTFHALYDFPVVLLRIFMVYGPGQRDLTKLVPYTILSLLRGERPRFTSGDRETDWVYVLDVVDALLAAAAADDVEGRTIDVGSGRLVSVRTIVEDLFRLMDAGTKPEFGAIPARRFETSRRADLADATKLLGWRPSTDLRDGLAATIDWYRQQAPSLP